MTSFAIDAAELNPALKALSPITRGVVKGEPETAGVCEMVYCRTTTSGELLMATADLTHKLVAAVTVPLVDFDGELAEFAIGREKLKQIMAIFKPDEEANKPVVVEVARNKVPLRGVEQVITMTEGGNRPIPIIIVIRRREMGRPALAGNPEKCHSQPA